MVPAYVFVLGIAGAECFAFWSRSFIAPNQMILETCERKKHLIFARNWLQARQPRNILNRRIYQRHTLRSSEDDFEEYYTEIQNKTRFVPPKLSGLRPIGEKI